METKRAIGDRGENAAADYLVSHGYTILNRNYLCRGGEIDIIARKDGYLVFAEVKYRKDTDHGEAREFVTAAKQQRILRTAMHYLSTHETDLQPRFDVLEVYPTNGLLRRSRVVHIEAAFE